MTTPNEHSEHSPAPDASRPLLDGMASAWRAVYDMLREAQALAVLTAQDRPQDGEAQAIHRASSAAVRAFRQEYQKYTTGCIAAQIEGLGTE